MIVAYQAIQSKDGVSLERSFGGVVDSLSTKSLQDAVEWITEPYPHSHHITTRLSDFADAVVSLLSSKDREILTEKNRLVIDNIKIFYIDRWFGITFKKPLHGNFVELRETNIFGIEPFMPNDGGVPRRTTDIEQKGIELETALNKMGIDAENWTSPVGVIGDSLRNYNLPTVYSNSAIRDAAIYCEIMMRREWRSAYQIGYFDKAYLYDMRSAYPSFIKDLPNTDKCQVKYSKEWLKADWAIVKANVDITSDYTPIVSDADEHTLTLGKRLDIFTSEELCWLGSHKAAKIDFVDGYFFKWQPNLHPYRKAIDKLWGIRQDSDTLVSYLAKRMGQGLSGKLDQDNADGSLGEFYNPICAAITRSRCRLAVADFIWNNALQGDLIAVQVDGLLATKCIELPETASMGSWRVEETPALVLGKGGLWQPGKRYQDIAFEDIVKAMKAHPQREYYEFDKKKFIDLRVMATDIDRIYDTYPKNGYEALNSISRSKPCITTQ